MGRIEFLSRFDFEHYVLSKFDDVQETSNPEQIRVHCPFCHDKSAHLYILIPAGLVYCQRCKYDPKSPIKFISDLEKIPIQYVLELASDEETFNVVKTSVSEIIDKLFYEDLQEDTVFEPIELDKTYVPVVENTGIFVVDRMIETARNYLKCRKITDKEMHHYDIRIACMGEFAGRVIVPCNHNGNTVSFVARDITGNSDRKYLYPSGTKQSNFLFNLDKVKSDYVVLTEGVFDVIHIGKKFPAVASFGKSLSKVQTGLLERFNRVIFYWDSDAYPQAEKYSKKVHAECLTVLHPDDEDAGSRALEESERMIESAVHFDNPAYCLYKVTNGT